LGFGLGFEQASGFEDVAEVVETSPAGALEGDVEVAEFFSVGRRIRVRGISSVVRAR